MPENGQPYGDPPYKTNVPLTQLTNDELNEMLAQIMRSQPYAQATTKENFWGVTNPFTDIDPLQSNTGRYPQNITALDLRQQALLSERSRRGLGTKTAKSLDDYAARSQPFHSTTAQRYGESRGMPIESVSYNNEGNYWTGSPRMSGFEPTRMQQLTDYAKTLVGRGR